MTEQQHSSAVVEETKQADGYTPPPKNAEKNNRAGKTSLALSVIAIAIALAAGVGLYGWVKQQTTVLRATNDELANQSLRCSKRRTNKKPGWKALLNSRPRSLKRPNVSKTRSPCS